MDEDEKYALTQVNVTLNGRPARISGYKHEFARVYDIETLATFEWSWDAVERIVENGGHFKTS